MVEKTLKAKAAAGELIKIVVYIDPGEGHSYLAAHFIGEPVRPIYLATRRDRNTPKLYLDSHRLLSNIYRDYPGIPVQTELPDLGIKAAELL